MAIPTKYRGRQFRSRLEARWAAFFDNLGWSWEYEPFDLDGWIPDFSIRCPRRDIRQQARGRVLVEVKPVSVLPFPVCREIERAVDEDEHVMIVGSSVPGTHLGWIRRNGDRTDTCDTHDPLTHPRFWWFSANLMRVENDRIDFSWHEQGMITEGDDQKLYGSDAACGSPAWCRHLDRVDERLRREVYAHWQDAANKVQWRAPV